MKKETKLGLAVSKSEDFHEWYRLLVLEAELISTYSVSGTVIRQHSPRQRHKFMTCEHDLTWYPWRLQQAYAPTFTYGV